MMKNDSQLQSDVQTELKWTPSLHAAQIGVAAKCGVVTLTGQVAHYAEKTRAEDSAKGVYGVKAIANDIVVELPGSSKRTDADIAAAALSAMSWDFEVPNDKVQVVVKNGWVKLEGTVEWQYQKDAAERCVRYLSGVAAVTNSITIKARASVDGVKCKIEDAFRRNADLDARRIAVETKDGTVKLSGSVASWLERDTADAAAWSAPGVNYVDDQLVVVP
jgi:osmotically-inducible protein OsmY